MDDHGEHGRDSLRERALALMRELDLEDPARPGAYEIKRLLNELEVHRIELELQNEELRATQTRLEILKDRYLRLFDFAPMAYAIFDDMGLVVEANLTAAALLGIDRTRLAGKPFSIHVAREGQDLFYRHRTLVLETGNPAECEIDLVTRAGRTLRAVLKSQAVTDETGERLCLTGIEDLTERRRAEAGLIESEKRFREVVERTPAGVCLTDETGRFVYVNPAYCRLYGYAPDELLGRSFTLVVPPDRREAMQVLHDRYIAGATEVQGEWEVMRKDGSRLTVLADAARLTGPDGRPRKATFIMDVTERKRAEQLREDVERMTRHDLKTPLGGLIHLPEMILADGNLTGEQRELLEVIRESGYRMLDLINVSLDLFKMESGTYGLRPGRVDAEELTRRIIRELRGLIKAHGVTVTIGRDELGGKVVLLGEELLCYSMLANLVKNAVEASPEGGEVRVDLGRDGRLCRVAVANPGMVPAEIRSRFFEKYATFGKYGGTGIGAYSARLIAETHGGRIDMTTSEAEGTRIVVLLPAAP